MGADDDVIDLVIEALSKIKEKKEPHGAFDDCEPTLSKPVTLPIRLPNIGTCCTKLEFLLASRRAMKDVGITDLVVPYIRYCVLTYEVFGVDDPFLIGPLGTPLYKTPFGILDRPVNDNDEKIGVIVGLHIGPADFPIGFYAWRSNAEGVYVTTVKTLLVTALFIMRNPLVIDALKRAVMEVYGEQKYVEAIDELHETMGTVYTAIKLLR